MSEVGKWEASDTVLSSFNTHVFTCPYCRRHTSLLSSQTFISLERTECGNCGQEFLVENDTAHAMNA